MHIVEINYKKLGPVICFSNYSILFGYNSVDSIINGYKDKGFLFCSITDINLMSGFQNMQANQNNTQLNIYGIAFTLCYKDIKGLAYAIFYCQQGYYNFVALYNKKVLSIVNNKEKDIVFYLQDFDNIKENCGYYILIGCSRSLIDNYISLQYKSGNTDVHIKQEINELIKAINFVFKDNLYYICNDLTLEEQHLFEIICNSCHIDKQKIIYNYPIVHLDDIFYTDYIASPHIDLVAISSHKKVTDVISENTEYFSNIYCLLCQDQFVQRCANAKLLENTYKFFNNLFLYKFCLSLEDYTISYTAQNAKDLIYKYAYNNLINLLLQKFIDIENNKEKIQEIGEIYYKRFLTEKSTYNKIESTDVYSMLYVVHKFVLWGKNNYINIGPGRGSCVGSLIIFLLDITSIDPIPHKLLFERFINLDRLSMPDIDIDVCKERRGELIRHIGLIFRDKYNKKNIVHIIVFLKFIFKMVTKDLIRVSNSNLTFLEINRILKIYDNADSLSQYLNYLHLIHSALIKASGPNKVIVNKNKAGFIFSLINRIIIKTRDFILRKYTIPKEILYSHNHEEILKSVKFIFDKISELTKIMKNLGNYSHGIKTSGIHAAGLLIGSTNFLKKIPLYYGANAEQEKVVCTQFDMSMLSQLNAVKFDILGLDNLSIVSDFFQSIGADNCSEHMFDLLISTHKDIADNVYNMLKLGAVKNVFQVEKFHVARLCKKLTIASFEDIVALNSLNRPGTSGMVQQYVDNKRLSKHMLKNKVDKFVYMASEETYGVIIYQEQVMKLVQYMANYKSSEADIFRSIISKKKKDLMDKEKEKFLLRCSLNNIEHEHATTIFEMIEKFAGYGFNKSHAVAYSKITLITAYLKYSNYVYYNLIGIVHKISKMQSVQQTIEILVEMAITLKLWITTANINNFIDISYNNYQYNFDCSFFKVIKTKKIKITIPVYILKGISKSDAIELRNNYQKYNNLFDSILYSKITKSKLALLNSLKFFKYNLNTDLLYKKIESLRNLYLYSRNNLYDKLNNDKNNLINDFIINDEQNIKKVDSLQIENIGFSIIRANTVFILKKILQVIMASNDFYLIYKVFEDEYYSLSLFDLLKQKSFSHYKAKFKEFDVIYITDNNYINLTNLLIEQNDMHLLFKIFKIEESTWKITFNNGRIQYIDKNTEFPFSQIYYLFNTEKCFNIDIVNNISDVQYY